MESSDRTQEIIHSITEYKKHSEDARQPIKQMWDISWQLFNQQYDFSNKASWQSKIYIPKLSGAIRSAVALFKQAFLRNKDWNSIESRSSKYKDVTPIIQHNQRFWVDKVNLINTFVESLHAGLLSSMMIFKVYWRKTKTNENSYHTGPMMSTPSQIIKVEKSDTIKRFIASSILGPSPEPLPGSEEYDDGELVVEAVDPYRFYLDPTGRNRYVIEEIIVDWSELKATAKQKGYDVSKIDEDYIRQAMEYEESIRKNQAPNQNKPAFRKEVKLWEFWGDIIGENGEILYRNVTCTIANDKYLIRKPTKNPFWHQSFPYVWGPIIRKPFSVWHKGFADDLHGLQIALTEFINSIMDSNLVASMNAFEVDLDFVADPEQIRTGMHPQKMFKKNGGGVPGAQMIKEIPIGNFNPASVRIYGELDRIFQNESVITEFVSGQGGAGGRQTATEVVSKTNQASSLIQDIAVDIENFVLSPLLEKMFQVCLQYQRKFDDERMEAFVNSDIVNKIILLSDEERRTYISDTFRFKAFGLSGYLNRLSEVQKFSTFTQFFQMYPQLLNKFNSDKLMKKIVEWMNWDPEDMLIQVPVAPVVNPANVQQQSADQQALTNNGNNGILNTQPPQISDVTGGFSRGNANA